jgi:predicted ATP-dependent endonuclease of OLD family
MLQHEDQPNEGGRRRTSLVQLSRGRSWYLGFQLPKILNHFLLRAYRYDSSEHMFTQEEIDQLKQARDILDKVYDNRKKNSEEHFGIISKERRKELKQLKKDEISRRQNKV